MNTVVGTASRVRGHLDGALDYATQGSPGEEPTGVRQGGGLSALRGTTGSYLGAGAATLGVFMLVAGAPGTREPLPVWLAGGPTAHASVAYATACLMVAAAATWLVHMVRATPHPRSRWIDAPLWPYVTGVALSAGAAVQMRLTHEASDAIVPAVALLAGMLAAVVWNRVFAHRLTCVPRRALATAWVITAVAFVVRFVLPGLSGGSLARGELLGVNVGEVSRAAVLVAAALALTGVEQQAIDNRLGRLRARSLLGLLAVRLAPMLAYTALLLTVRDRGPALVLGVVMVTMVLASVPRTWLRQAVPVVAALALATATAGMLAPTSQVPGIREAQEVMRTRVFEAGCADGELTQACKSQRILHVTGLAPDVDPFGSPLTHTLEAANSDYAPTLVGGALGMLALLLLLAGVVAVAARLVTAAGSAPPPRTEQRDANNRLALGAGTAILVTASWLGMAILLPRIPFTGATLPLTGLDVPFLSANGGSSVAYGFLVALAVLGLRANMAGDGTPAAGAPSAKVGAASLAIVLVMAVGVAWIALGRGPAAAGATRLTTESLLRDTSGRILTRDGQEFSRPADPARDDGGRHGQRIYPVPAWAVDLGFFQPGASINQAAGLEYLAAPLLTCGRHRDGVTAGLLAKCRGADVVTTIDGRLQTLAGRTAAAVAADYSPQTTTADVVVVERRTGAVTVAASSASLDPAMQSIVAGEDIAWQPAVMSEGSAITPTPARVRSYALHMLNPLAATCVEPRDGLGNPFGASAVQCREDQDGLRMMQPFRHAAPPGSTFKAITALAAERADTGLPTGSLGERLAGVGPKPVYPPMNNRSTLGACPQETIPAMLQYSCNTTAGWLGVSAGAAQINSAAAYLGFDPSDSSSTVRGEAGTVYGPADPSSGDPTPGALYFSTSRTGLADDETDPSALVRTAIGQQSTRASVMDLAGITASIADAAVPRMTLIDGVCRNGDYAPMDIHEQLPGEDLDPAQLAAVRQGMVLSVTGDGGTAGGMDAYGVRLAKTGTADDGSAYQRWVMGATDGHVFAARVGPVGEGRTRERNPAVGLAEAVLGQLDDSGPVGNPCAA